MKQKRKMETEFKKTIRLPQVRDVKRKEKKNMQIN